MYQPIQKLRRLFNLLQELRVVIKFNLFMQHGHQNCIVHRHNRESVNLEDEVECAVVVRHNLCQTREVELVLNPLVVHLPSKNQGRNEQRKPWNAVG